MEQSSPKFKTYVLLEEMNPHNTNLFRRVNKNQREVINRRRDYDLLLRVTVIKKDGSREVLRYKENTEELNQKKQIELGILANTPFTANEYSVRNFIYGTKTTNDPILQKYLDEYPGNSDNDYTSPDVPRKEFKELDFAKESKQLNAATRKRVQAVNKIIEWDLEQTKEALYRIYGTQYKPSEELEDNQNALVAHLDKSDDAVNEILKEEMSSDEEVRILVGRALTAEILSFDKSLGQVSLKKDGEWVNVKAIGSDYEPQERERQFIHFLASEKGVDLKHDIEADLGYELDDESGDNLDGLFTNSEPRKKGRKPKIQ